MKKLQLIDFFWEYSESGKIYVKMIKYEKTIWLIYYFNRSSFSNPNSFSIQTTLLTWHLFSDKNE